MSEASTERKAPAPSRLRVMLIGNYAPDRQESMLRFANVLLKSLNNRGIEASLISPRPFFNRFGTASTGFGKWLGYLDKFLLFPFELNKAIREATGQSARVVVHICDHSNAMYALRLRGVPVAITCHDLLAVRGALGEQTDCPASRTGEILQRWILRGLAAGTMLVCDSTATEQDAQRLVQNAIKKTRLLLLGLNHPFKVQSPSGCAVRLAQAPGLKTILQNEPNAQFLLHIGSNLRRKNREGLLRIFQKMGAHWNGYLILAGPPVSPELRALARNLGIDERVIEVTRPGDDIMEALYNRAFALLFPSRFEGFGWPVIEAQACGCPVVCSASGPLPEVAGSGALIRDVEDEDGFVEALLQLTDSKEREILIQRGLANVQRFTTERMIDEYMEVYRELAE